MELVYTFFTPKGLHACASFLFHACAKHKIVSQRETMVPQGRQSSALRLHARAQPLIGNPKGYPDHLSSDDHALCACMQGLLKSKILNALDCFPKAARAVCAF